MIQHRLNLARIDFCWGWGGVRGQEKKKEAAIRKLAFQLHFGCALERGKIK